MDAGNIDMEAEAQGAPQDELQDSLQDEGDASIGGLLARLADDAGRLVRAEIGMQRALLLHRLALARPSLVALALALLLALAATSCIAVMTAVSLAIRIGPMLAGLVVGGGLLIVATLVARAALRRLDQLVEGDPE